MVKISILIPVYNTEKYLKKCLDSVINQTLQDIEIIIVNDGSKDNSQEIIEEYAKKDKRIKYFVQENAGLGATRNKGIELSTGEYIAFLDSDDWVELNCYEEMYNSAISNNSDLVIVDYYIDHEKKSFKYKNEYKFNQKEKYLKDVLLRNVSGFSWNKLYKKEIIDKNKMKFPIRGELENIEDQYFTTRFVYLSNNISFVNKPLIHYIIRNSSIVNTYQNGLLEDGLALYNANKDLFKNTKYIEVLDVGLLKHIVQIILNEAKSCNKSSIKNKVNNINSILKNILYNEKINDLKLNKFNCSYLGKEDILYLKLLSNKKIHTLYILSKIRMKSIEWRTKSYE